MLDRYGDPLPLGAIGRLGTQRFRHGDIISAIAVSRDGSKVVSVGHSAVIHVWDVATGRDVHMLTRERLVVDSGAWLGRLADRTSGGGSTLAVSPDGKTLASAGADGSLRLWELVSQKERARFEVPEGIIHDLAFSPDGRIIASAGSDTNALVWDTFYFQHEALEQAGTTPAVEPRSAYTIAQKRE